LAEIPPRDNIMTGCDYTDLGGAGYVFLTTHWSLIEGIQSTDDKNRSLIDLLLKRYWKPVYCYLRRKGHNNEQAKDLTQGFFHEVVLNRDLVQRADQSKGRFRAFLLHALDQYLSHEKSKQMTQKRFPKGGFVFLDLNEPPVLPTTISELTPEDSYNYVWLSELLEQVLSEVETDCHEDGMDVHWKVFCDRIVQPTLENSKPPSLAETCRRYNIEDEKRAANMAITVKRRFQTLLRKHVRNTVSTESEVPDELQEIMQYLP
jgi:DNA-directed RNA polymerase specialized sigma24 family protein